MSNIFISYTNSDAEVARRLERRLLDKGPRVRIPVEAAVPGLWRKKYTQALVAADVLVGVLSEAALLSENVLGEIGAARVMEDIKGMLLLPVVVGDMRIPDFISDVS